jgi:hypothetical protein
MRVPFFLISPLIFSSVTLPLTAFELFSKAHAISSTVAPSRPQDRIKLKVLCCSQLSRSLTALKAATLSVLPLCRLEQTSRAGNSPPMLRYELISVIQVRELVYRDRG